MVSEKLNQAVHLIKSGNKLDALPILKEIVQIDPNNENAWLWLYSCVDKVEQKKYCLHQALRINPNNKNARAAVEKLENQKTENITATDYKQKKGDAPKRDPKYASNRRNIQAIIMLIVFSITLLVVGGIYILTSKTSAISLPVPFPVPTATMSIESKYANSVDPIIGDLRLWQSEWDDFLSLLVEPTDWWAGEGKDGMSRIEILVSLYSGLTAGALEAGDNGEVLFPQLNDLVEPSIKLSNDGRKILNVINVTTPVFDLESSKTQIIQCIKVRNAFTDAIKSSIPSRTPHDFGSGSTENCDVFEAAVEKLINFVNTHKSK
ncbi:tetratricopeptide repeat protein [bacterium]|nr:tetratricopeptide repeat protein [bacterium]